jgi:hypothetical protein
MTKTTSECHYCGDLLLPKERDHYRPRCRGGKDNDTVVACISCNRSKGTMLVHEWMAWRKHHGMPWPPVASHATRKQPEHYQDGSGCDAGKASWGPTFDGRDCPTLMPESMCLDDRNGVGYTAYYRCPIHNNTYRVSWSASPYWFDDCQCSFCVSVRSEEEY